MSTNVPNAVDIIDRNAEVLKQLQAMHPDEPGTLKVILNVAANLRETYLKRLQETLPPNVLHTLLLGTRDAFAEQLRSELPELQQRAVRWQMSHKPGLRGLLAEFEAAGEKTIQDIWSMCSKLWKRIPEKDFHSIQVFIMNNGQNWNVIRQHVITYLQEYLASGDADMEQA